MASEAIPSMLAIISSPDCPQLLTVAILKTLSNIADRYPLQNINWPQDNRLAEILFTPDTIGCFARIIASNSSSTKIQTCATFVANIITRLCTEETHKAALAEYGILDALALKIASFVVAQGFVLPGAENHLGQDGALSVLPQPAPSTAKLGPILRATSIIIENSKWRAEHFLSSPGIVTVFPGRLPEFSPTDIKRNPWGMPYLSGSAVPRQTHTNPMDALLPVVPLAQNSASTNFPPLVPIGSFHKRSLSFLEAPSYEEDESALVPWLFHMVRTENGMSRVMAARLVTGLFRLGLARKHRIPMFNYLVTPLLLRMLDKDYDFRDESDPDFDGMIPTALGLKEEVPSIIATLVMDTQELQKHAVEASAIKILSQLLKETYNPHSENGKPMWYAESKDKYMESAVPATLQLGPVGYSPMTCHIMRYREGILRALAALAPFRDEYRKAICENGVVPYIIDSLKPRPALETQDTTGTKNTAADGNSIPTLLAACGAARALTRSVSVLRTSLIDAGVATPLFELIKHRDIEVQIAATSAIISAGILPILCDHAHSNNTKLRLESLWALKHIAYNSTNDIKNRIVTGLGAPWLAEIMSMDPTSKRSLVADFKMGMGTSNSAGEKVDLLNPMEDASRAEESRDNTLAGDSGFDALLADPNRRKKLAMSGEIDQSRQARQDDIAVQEQALDLVRNIMCGNGAAEIVDFFLAEIGHQEFLSILAEKMRPRPNPTRRDTAANPPPPPMPAEILVAVTYVLVNLAAGPPKQRDLLFTHRELLKNLMWLFEHPNRVVRVNCVWVVINLTYEDDQSDRQASYERAVKLKSLGVIDRLRSVEEDSDLDVRERTKTALHQIRKYMNV
ncbi:hypothetical protein EIK77_008101 [Talaromyces pinophilus]|nr:hypothetical protein EIK77_008101 [Talaromyces pinophilus]